MSVLLVSCGFPFGFILFSFFFLVPLVVTNHTIWLIHSWFYSVQNNPATLFCLSQVSTWILSVPVSTWILCVPSQHMDSVCLKSAHGFCLSQVRTWILSVSSLHLDYVCLKSTPGLSMSYVVVFLCFMSSVKMRGNCSFWWYWRSWCPLLFKSSLHNSTLDRMYIRATGKDLDCHRKKRI